MYHLKSCILVVKRLTIDLVLNQEICPGQNLGFRIQIIPSFSLQISVILTNLFCKNYSNVILQIKE